MTISHTVRALLASRDADDLEAGYALRRLEERGQAYGEARRVRVGIDIKMATSGDWRVWVSEYGKTLATRVIARGKGRTLSEAARNCLEAMPE